MVDRLEAGEDLGEEGGADLDGVGAEGGDDDL